MRKLNDSAVGSPIEEDPLGKIKRASRTQTQFDWFALLALPLRRHGAAHAHRWLSNPTVGCLDLSG